MNTLAEAWGFASSCMNHKDKKRRLCLAALLLLALGPGWAHARTDDADPALPLLGLAVGATAAGLALDEAARDESRRHDDAWLSRRLSAIDWLPAAGLGLAAVASLIPASDDRLAQTSRQAVSAGIYAAGITLVAKQLTGRRRPADSDDATEFHPFDGYYDALDGPAFPSGHSAVAWALITPYAKEYDLPALYALPAAVGLGRITADEHWLSDVVAGGFLGYLTAEMVRQPGQWLLWPDRDTVRLLMRF